MVAKSGDHLLQKQAQGTLISELIPLAHVITPNIYEAEILAETYINTIEDMHIAAKNIYKLGVKNVIIKGGHTFTEKYAMDILYNGKHIIEYKTLSLNTKNTHGSGCTFASAIAPEIAKGNKIEKAAHIAKVYLTTLIKHA